MLPCWPGEPHPEPAGGWVHLLLSRPDGAPPLPSLTMATESQTLCKLAGGHLLGRDLTPGVVKGVSACYGKLKQPVRDRFGFRDVMAVIHEYTRAPGFQFNFIQINHHTFTAMVVIE